MHNIFLNKYILILLLTIIHCIFFRDIFFHWNDYLLFGDINPYDLNTKKWINDALYTIYPYNGTGTMQPPYPVVMILGYIYSFLGLFLSHAIISKFFLVVYILFAPVCIFLFLESFFQRYIKDIPDNIAISIGTLCIIISILINQILLYPLTYFYYPILLIPIALLGLYRDRIVIFILGIIGLYVFVGVSQILILSYGLIFLAILFDYYQKRTKIVPYVTSIVFIGLFYLIPLLIYMLFRENTILSESLTSNAIANKSNILYHNTIRFFSAWFTSPYRSPMGETLPRNPYYLYNNNLFLIITSILPISMVVLGFFRSFLSKGYIKSIYLNLVVLFCIHFMFFTGFITHTIFDEVFRGVEKFVTNMLLILGVLVMLVTYKLKISIQILILILFLGMNTKVWTGDVLLPEVWVETPVYSSTVEKYIADKKVLFLPIVKGSPWVPEIDGSFSYSIFPILYNTYSFTPNAPNKNKDIFDIQGLDMSTYAYVVYMEKLQQFIMKYNIEKIVFYKKYSYGYHFGVSSYNQTKVQLESIYRIEYEDNDILVYNTLVNAQAGVQGGDIFQKINSTQYYITTNLKYIQDLKFPQSFHPQWKLYLQPFTPLDCGSGTMVYSGTTISDLGVSDTYSVTECPSANTFYAGGELAKLWETPIFDDTHTMVYDYANQWTIDPEYIRANYSREYYRENPDGTIDVRMTMYFRPQSYFYLGLIISGLTLFGCSGYIVISSTRNRKINKSTQIPK